MRGIEPDRQAQVEAIVSFLREHGECQAARAICLEVLGKHVALDERAIGRVSDRLPRLPPEQIERFYDLVM